jgi:carboxymethylenebutenolidase
MTQLIAADGHLLDAYVAHPAGTPKGGIVVLQEIFGVNGHIRKVADGFAAQGYLAVAPALFDRVEPGVALGYDEAGIARGLEIRAAIPLEGTIADVAAAVAEAAQGGKVGVVGYCWGGLLTYLATARIPRVAAGVGYYGGNIPAFLGEAPKVPLMLQFGEEDHGIPLTQVEAIRAARPEIPVHLYPAGHGFNCDERGSYHAESAALALERTLAFFADHLG